MVRSELYKAFQVDHRTPWHPYPLDIEPAEEDKKEEHFKLEEEDLWDKATIGLKLQEFVAKEQIKDLVAIGQLPKDSKLEGNGSPMSS